MGEGQAALAVLVLLERATPTASQGEQRLCRRLRQRSSLRLLGGIAGAGELSPLQLL